MWMLPCKKSGCEFCTEKSIIELINGTELSLYARISAENYLTFEGFNAEGEVDYYQASVKYCPMCGKKLGGE